MLGGAFELQVGVYITHRRKSRKTVRFTLLDNVLCIFIPHSETATATPRESADDGNGGSETSFASLFTVITELAAQASTPMIRHLEGPREGGIVPKDAVSNSLRR
jgi:hypothetical protein